MYGLTRAGDALGAHDQIHVQAAQDDDIAHSHALRIGGDERILAGQDAGVNGESGRLIRGRTVGGADAACRVVDKAIQQNDRPFVQALADRARLILGGDLEYQAAAVDLLQLGPATTWWPIGVAARWRTSMWVPTVQ